MSMLTNGLSGALAAQASLNIISQNVANSMTPGYSRQGVLLNAMPTQIGGIGGGVKVSSLLRFADNYKNLQLWQAASNQGQYQAGQTYLTQLEQVMSDDTANINAGMDQFFAALNAASVQPESGPLREQVITAADALVKRFDSMQRLFTSQQTAIATQRQGIVGQINALTQDIAALNKQIAVARSSGVSDSDLQDARDERIKSLSGLVGVQVVDLPDGGKSVSLRNGQPLVIASDAAVMSGEINQPLTLKFVNTTFTVPDSGLGGQLGGLADLQNQILLPQQQTIKELGTGLGDAINAVLAGGFAPPATTPGQPLFDTTGGVLKLTSLSAADLAFSANATDSGNSDNLSKLVALRQSTITVTTFDSRGNVTGSGPAVMGDVYTQLLGKLGVASGLNASQQKTAQTVLDQAQQSRDSSSAVNRDEEAVNLMQYQQMYQSNMKVVSVANDLFDATLAMLG
ncbi:MAG: flagellar hook-associated protein FlgK [Roseateles depolymerans]|uniref:Flagellar hook-associated protein 1 n=1 Tax=Roseateles depolymerans TaxID=76731 RepID=A0A2W5DY96_9BURK|nr:MAG: flagellar hook-associated protein FlgK [Roseateles depolymerans]